MNKMPELCTEQPKELWVPPLQEYEIRIKFLDRGCVISVGCKSIAFENVEQALTELNDYVNNHREVFVKWNKIFNEK